MKKTHKIIAILVIGAGVCTAMVLPLTGDEKPAPKAKESTPRAEAIIAPAKPETWDTAIAKVKKNQDAIAEILIAVAKDEKRSDEDRRKAIYGLGDLRTKDSLEFLIANVSHKIPMPFGGESRILKDTPCRYMLWKGDWNTAKAIMRRSWMVCRRREERRKNCFSLVPFSSVF